MNAKPALNDLVQHSFFPLISGTVVGIDHSETTIDTCIGFTRAFKTSYNRIPSALHSNKLISWAPDLDHYHSYQWVSHKDIELILPKAVVSIPTPPQTLICCSCNDRVSYAEPNQANGSFKCFQCRSNRFYR